MNDWFIVCCLTLWIFRKRTRLKNDSRYQGVNPKLLFDDEQTKQCPKKMVNKTETGRQNTMQKTND